MVQEAEEWQAQSQAAPDGQGSPQKAEVELELLISLAVVSNVYRLPWMTAIDLARLRQTLLSWARRSRRDRPLFMVPAMTAPRLAWRVGKEGEPDPFDMRHAVEVWPQDLIALLGGIIMMLLEIGLALVGFVVVVTLFAALANWYARVLGDGRGRRTRRDK